ncbi:MAG: hypothetical protein ACD_9C00313G0008 [uncultured bacterium]|nr:MAG: hypothetical protein ACD_9C00313G0008 [uncultured bacterium]
MKNVVFNKIAMENKDKSNAAWWQPGLQLFLRLSAWIGGPIIIAVVVGKFLDNTFGTAPWLLLLSVSIAFIVSIVMIVRIGLREMGK